jgi:hypothetical protein
MLILLVTVRSRGSSVSIVSDWTTGRSRFDPGRGEGIFTLTSLSSPALWPTQPPVQWVPGIKRGQGVTLTTHPHLVPRSWMSGSYISSPTKRLHGVWWDSFTFYFFFTVHCYGVVLHKAFQAVLPLLMYCAFPIWVLFIPVSPITAVWQHPAETPVAKQEKLGGKMAVNFFDELSLSYSARFLTAENLTTWDRRLYFLSERNVLRIFIALEIGRPYPGLNPRTLGQIASMITSRPPRTTSEIYLYYLEFVYFFPALLYFVCHISPW